MENQKINFRDPNWREPHEAEIMYITRRAEMLTHSAQMQPNAFGAKAAAAAWDRAAALLSDMADLSSDPNNWGPVVKIQVVEMENTDDD